MPRRPLFCQTCDELLDQLAKAAEGGRSSLLRRVENCRNTGAYRRSSKGGGSPEPILRTKRTRTPAPGIGAWQVQTFTVGGSNLDVQVRASAVEKGLPARLEQFHALGKQGA
jgi:hypothetical protein